MRPKSTVFKCVSVLISLLFFMEALPVTAAEMEDYCVVPPYVKRDVSVNIMILMDNSVDMLAPAYTDDIYCPSRPIGNTNCWDNANNKYYRTYMGHFPPDACYLPPGSKFKYAGGVDFNINHDTGCPSGQFNGNVLNWIAMSRYTIAKKVLTGEASTSINEPFEIEGDASYWPSSKESLGCGWLVQSSSAKVLSLKVENRGVAGSCKYPIGGYWDIKIDPTPGIEVRTGILQEFTDVNADKNFDKGSPRFGVTIFSQTGVTTDITIPPGNYEPFINTIKTMRTRANNDLATAHYTDIEYFKSPANVSVDPYKGCASWESPPCVQGTPVPCRKSFILMVTTGTDITGTAEPSASPCTQVQPLERNACYAFNTDLRTSADLPGKQKIETYVVHTFGSPAKANEAVLKNTAALGGGQYYSAGTDDLADVLRQALQDIIKRAAAGTAASVLASGEGQGANLIQAVFYPRTQKIKLGGIYDNEIAWTGRLANYWYYVDSFFENSTILEDTIPDGILNLKDDLTVRFRYDPSNEQTVADLYHFRSDTKDHTVILENVSTLWEAGLELWERNLAITPRTVYTTTDGTNLRPFSTNAEDVEALLPNFDLPTTDSDLDGFKDGDLNRSGGNPDSGDAEILIRYVKGEDFAGLRSRTTGIDLNRDGEISGSDEEEQVWKLGDVLNSTPKISSWIPLSSYHRLYSDGTYGPVGQDPLSSDPADPTHYITTEGYKGRGTVFAGGNDGMLHAFKLGTLKINCKDCETPAQLTGDDLGKEIWAFIPKNALPYLKYLTDPGYCHIYTVDFTPYIFDASINGLPDDDKAVSSWKTILIGGMRLGGACKNFGSSCTADLNGDGLINEYDCVKTPIGNVGYSSYFALDVTEQNNPKLLWEFSHDELGFASTGPAVVRIGEKTKNGNWFVVFGSGPTGPISRTDQQFLGNSDQNLKIFVLDLKTGNLASGYPRNTGIANAFAGSLLNATFDSDLDYQDEVVYIPYVKKCTTTNSYCEANKWNDGGVLRLLTKKSSAPSQWVLSTVIDGIGPVTSAVTKLENKNKGILWLYFGTGRYYFEQLATIDDGNLRRTLFGVKEPCFSASGFDVSCTSTVSGLTDVSNIANIPTNPDSSSFKGWYITLEDDGNYTYLEGSPPTTVTRKYRTERVITDPLATSTGIVFFTTYKPYDDVCALGGKSFIWALKYNTGGAPGPLLKGVALLQVSTGAIEQVDLAKAMTEMSGRRTSAMEGVPPTAQGLSILSPPPPVKRTIHMRER